jgi:hypothetical protein
MMGEMENGSSMMVNSSLRPGNVKRAINHAALIPMARLTGRVITATTEVSQIACSVSGARMFWAKTAKPSDSARQKI